ncbi:hypothetical protein EDB86DRAFT_3080017 [Lactarius hatsudake]|nr:hypothetical protein EDB86DRAFT_3080017 [Lactarius hatsudake]
MLSLTSGTPTGAHSLGWLSVLCEQPSGPLVTGIPTDLVNVQALWYNNSADMDILLVINTPPDIPELIRPRQYGNRDPKALKLFIAVILYLVLNFGNVGTLDHNMWAMNIQVGVNTLVVYMVQLFYAQQVYILLESIIIPIIIVIFGAASFALAFVFTVRAFWSRYTSLIPVIAFGLESGIVADLLITGSMAWFYYHSRTGFARTDSVIMTLMTYSVNSAALTSAYQRKGFLVYLVIFLCYDQLSTASSSMYWQLFFWPLGNLYANSLLAMLNNRDYFRERLSAKDKYENAFGLSSIRIEQRRMVTRRAASVAVDRSTTTDFPPGERDHDIESSTAENSNRGEYSL